MKEKLSYYICCMIILLCQITACRDISDEQPIEPISGERGELELNFEKLSERDIHITRSGNVKEKEPAITSLRVYVFNDSGKLTGYKSLEDRTGKSLSGNNRKVKVTTNSGRSYIYAIANLESSQYFVSLDDFRLLDVGEGKVQSSELTRDRFLKIRFQRMDNSLQPLDGSFLMSGHVNDGNPVILTLKDVRNLKISSPSEPEKIQIKLYRILASNKIRIQNKSDSDFLLKEAYLHNIPNSGYLMPPATAENATGVVKYERYIQLQLDSTNNLQFYCPENCQYINHGNNIKSWKDREANSYTADGVKEFTNAPVHASYVTLYGKYLNKVTQMTADVVYTIHLGNFGQGGGLNDFCVERNSKYSYLITINGINDVIAEAKKEGDYPYAEGNVMHIGNGIVYELDAHYESRVLKFIRKSGKLNAFSRSENATHRGYMADITTPFGKSYSLCAESSEDGGKVYLYDILAPTDEKKPLCEIRKDGCLYNVSTGKRYTDEELKTVVGMSDFNWVKFRRNTKKNLIGGKTDIRNYVCKYPGDQYFMGSEEDMDINITGDKEPLINLFALLYNLEMHETDDTFWDKIRDVHSDETNCVYYTAFIDENYYADKTWDKYVNTPNRIMNIGSRSFISEDTHSVYSEVMYSLSQRSIKTFYNPAKAGEVKAFGIESVSEEQHPVSILEKRDNELYIISDEGNIEDYDNTDYDININSMHFWRGFTVACEALQGKSWDENIKIIPNQQPLYQKVGKAMLTRNRDLNGNGRVDKDEIRWYVGTEGQYAGTWYGEAVLPVETRLFDLNEMISLTEKNKHDVPNKWHYYTASRNEIFWAEEGSSTSKISQGAWSQARKVRCFRTLHSEREGLCDPDHFYTYTKRVISEPRKEIEIDVDCSRMAPEALRNNVNQELGVHYERDEQNKLPQKFRVSAYDAKNLKPGVDRKWFFNWYDVKNAKDVYLVHPYHINEKGWRLPNQRELGLMSLLDYELGILRQTAYWCRTKFNGTRYGYGGKGYDNSAGSYGYARLENGVITVEPGKTEMKVRCVKDLPSGRGVK